MKNCKPSSATTVGIDHTGKAHRTSSTHAHPSRQGEICAFAKILQLPARSAHLSTRMKCGLKRIIQVRYLHTSAKVAGKSSPPEQRDDHGPSARILRQCQAIPAPCHTALSPTSNTQYGTFNVDNIEFANPFTHYYNVAPCKDPFLG
jgi:hypothetical protein